MGNVVIVAIPDENDRVWKVSSEKVPHLTLLFLGEEESVSNLDQIVQFVGHAANTTLNRFYLPVDKRGELGDDKADVLFFRRGWYTKGIRDFRSMLLKDDNIRTAHDTATQHMGPWLPHLTLGYPSTPAKPDDTDRDFGFFDVGFNKIAVWTGDYEGPEFDLKDYWDEFELMEVAPMDVAMSDIQHFGVRGMRWGVRKDTTVTVDGKTKQVSAKKAEKLEKKWEKGAASVDTWVKVHNGAAEHFNARIGALNDKPEYKNLNLNDTPDSPTAKKYMTDVHELSKTALEQSVNKLAPSPTGKHKIGVVHGSEYGEWGLVLDKVKHAADDETTWVKTKRNAQGLVTSIEFVMNDSVAQSAIDVDEFMLEHFGVKGMRWGVRKVGNKIGSGVKAVGRGLSALGAALADSSWQQSTYSDVKHEAVHNHVAKELDNRVERLQRSPKYRGKNLKADADLRKSYYQDVAKVSESAYKRAVKETFGENFTGTKSAHYVTDARGARIEIRDKKTGEVAAESPLSSMRDIERRRNDAQLENVLKQAAETDFPDISIELKLDEETGQIVGVGFVKPSEPSEEVSLAQVLDRGEAFLVHIGLESGDSLEHYGVKGMRWGVRKDRPVPTAVTPTATSKVPHGTKRKTKIETKGGENHPAADDAIKVAKTKAKLAKSGPAALSNQELRELQERMNLERNVTQLVGSTTRVGKGRDFVRKLTGWNKELNDTVGTGLQTRRLVEQVR